MSMRPGGALGLTAHRAHGKSSSSDLGLMQEREENNQMVSLYFVVPVLRFALC